MQKDETQLVISYDNKIMTTSKLVAEKFGKKHDDLLKDIANLDCSKRFRARHFENAVGEIKGKSQLIHYITRDGFTLLALSFSGIRSVKRREDFIDQFNIMQAMQEHKNPPELLSSYTGRKAGERVKNVPRGYWSVFDQFHYVMLLAAKKGDSVKDFHLVEERVTKAWNTYRKRHEAFKFNSVRTFLYEFGDERENKDCHCYLDKELPLFINWLKEVYKKEEMRRHLQTTFAGRQQVLNKIDIAFPEQLKT